MHIATIRAKYSRKLQKPGYETNYEPQYAEFEATATFGDTEVADESDMDNLCDIVAAQVEYLLGDMEEGPTKSGTVETEVVVSRDTPPVASVVVPAPVSVARRRGGAQANPTVPGTADSASSAVSGGPKKRGAASPASSSATVVETKSPSKVSDEDMSKACSQLAKRHGTEAVFKLLSLYGVDNVAAIKADKRPEFLELVKQQTAFDAASDARA